MPVLYADLFVDAAAFVREMISSSDSVVSPSCCVAERGLAVGAKEVLRLLADVLGLSADVVVGRLRFGVGSGAVAAFAARVGSWRRFWGGFGAVAVAVAVVAVAALVAAFFGAAFFGAAFFCLDCLDVGVQTLPPTKLCSAAISESFF